MNIQEKLRGTGVALVTPFRNGKIDFPALENLINHVIQGGVNFLVSLGTTGESASTSELEHQDILKFTLEINNNRVPLVAGNFGGNNTKAICEKLEKYNLKGISAILSSNPAYVKPSQEGLFQHYMAIANSCDVPIILYNIPGRSASNMNADTTTRLAHESNKFIGIKEASNDLYQIMLILKNKPANFALWAGDDYITLPVIACGGHGVISVIANALPKMFTTMVNNALNFDLKTAKQQNDQLLDLYKILFAEGNPVGIKTALAFQNVTSPEVRLPLTAMSDDGVRLLTKNLQPLLPLN